MKADARIDELRSLLPQCMLPDWVRLGSRLVRLLRDQHHPDAHEAVLNRLLAQARASVELRERRKLQVPRITCPAELPITARKHEIVAAIRDNQVVVIAGETGSGKTTQIPKMCLEAGLGIRAAIGCTQPRRVAALSISRRIAEELGCSWGREVGCKIRFDDRSSSETYIKLMTDGILLAETQGDPLLSEYEALIIDEAHERSLNIDFLLGYLKTLLARRNDLKLIITSATIDTQAFSQAFNDAPIIEVSGRLYPVDVVYAPLDSTSEESGEMTVIDAAVNATERVLDEPVGGDVLIFMPTERDIRETSDLLEGRFGVYVDIIPLFGRLSSGEQQRVFAPSSRRKIVVATNIAETSLTIPGIRYVIDSGLARISRYNPRTRTKRLPVESISQSSANQRKGRSGRVQNGVCIRLYSEEDFEARPQFTQPEIQRANLAEVILRMKAFRLGEIESFSFINPPTPAAIDAGYRLLQELGALDDARELTAVGRDLARLPIDPTLGRMLLQSQHEHATRELLIIAAGLSIQDPRERPLDQRDAADAAHKRFLDPRSDFLTLLNLWNAFHEQWEKLRTQNQRRKFCKGHFLSYTRMREWQDLHAQLHDALEERGTVRLNESNASYPAIHRSILSGLLGHIAARKERNIYQAAGNRQVTIFPGSVLFERGEKPKKPAQRGGSEPAQPKARTNQPAWLMAGELVETSQLFARTVAGIDAAWIVELAAHLCRTTYEQPRWDVRTGRVVAREKVTLYGLEVSTRQVAYGNIDPAESTRIFIRSALVEESLFPEAEVEEREDPRGARKLTSFELLRSTSQAGKLPARYEFVEHNRRLRQKIDSWRTRVREHHLPDVDEALFKFYSQHIENVSSRDELDRLLRENSQKRFLCAEEADLTGGRDLSFDTNAFPDAVSIGGQAVPVQYAYAPGEEHDGATIRLALESAQAASPSVLAWSVPGLREELVAELLRSLPKALRKELMPFAPKIAEIVRELRPTGASLHEDLGRFLFQKYGVQVPVSTWNIQALPSHLKPRIEVVASDKKTIAAGRDLEALRRQLQTAKPEAKAVGESPEWLRARQRWERFGVTGWTFGDLPERITICETSPLPVYAWPGLEEEQGSVNVRLFQSADAAKRANLSGLQRLIELALQKDLAWLQKDLRAMARFDPLIVGWATQDELQAAAFEHLKQRILPSEPLPALAKAHFDQAVEQARARVPGLANQLIDLAGTILTLRREAALRCASLSPPAKSGRTLSSLGELGAKPSPSRGYQGMSDDLASLLPGDFLRRVSPEQLIHVPRYLKAMLTRAERAVINPVKDQEKLRQVAPYVQALRGFGSPPSQPLEAKRQVDQLRWMIEEFKVSVFAPELKTAYPISPKRLDEQIQRVRNS